MKSTFLNKALCATLLLSIAGQSFAIYGVDALEAAEIAATEIAKNRAAQATRTNIQALLQERGLDDKFFEGAINSLDRHLKWLTFQERVNNSYKSVANFVTDNSRKAADFIADNGGRRTVNFVTGNGEKATGFVTANSRKAADFIADNGGRRTVNFVADNGGRKAANIVTDNGRKAADFVMETVNNHPKYTVAATLTAAALTSYCAWNWNKSKKANNKRKELEPNAEQVCQDDAGVLNIIVKIAEQEATTAGNNINTGVESQLTVLIDQIKNQDLKTAMFKFAGYFDGITHASKAFSCYGYEKESDLIKEFNNKIKEEADMIKGLVQSMIE